MNAFLQEFFWTPEETVTWIRRVVPSFALWTVMWQLNTDAARIDPAALRSEMLTGLTEDAIQLFLGSPAICREPVWRGRTAKRFLDFQRSYAVQLVPSVLAPDGQTLLQGRLAILKPDQYEDCQHAKQLSVLFRRLQADMQQVSDSSRVVVQELAGGRHKIWKTILVGRSIPTADAPRLKQFMKGEVLFKVQPA